MCSSDLGTKFTNFPNITFSASSEVSGIESNIFQNISHTMYPMRSFDSSIYTSANFTSLKSPIYVTNLKVGNVKVSDSDKYIQYDSKFTSSTSGSTVENAFKNLLVANTESQQGKVNISLTEEIFKKLKATSQTTNPAVLINADFVTDGKMISNGRVNIGTWEIVLKRPSNKSGLSFVLQIQEIGRAHV